jgi:hypothetical protein
MKTLYKLNALPAFAALAYAVHVVTKDGMPEAGIMLPLAAFAAFSLVGAFATCLFCPRM